MVIRVTRTVVSISRLCRVGISGHETVETPNRRKQTSSTHGQGEMGFLRSCCRCLWEEDQGWPGVGCSLRVWSGRSSQVRSRRMSDLSSCVPDKRRQEY